MIFFLFQASNEDIELRQRQVILEKIRLPSKIKADEITEDLAKRLRNFDEEIVASDIEDWKRIINPAKNKKQKNPRASILITFHEESKAQKLCENSENTKRVHELKRSLTKSETLYNNKQWGVLNAKNMSDPDTSKVWLPEFNKGIVEIKEYPDSEGRREKMKEVPTARMIGKEFYSSIPDPPS